MQFLISESILESILGLQGLAGKHFLSSFNNTAPSLQFCDVVNKITSALCELDSKVGSHLPRLSICSQSHANTSLLQAFRKN